MGGGFTKTLPEVIPLDDVRMSLMPRTWPSPTMTSRDQTLPDDDITWPEPLPTITWPEHFPTTFRTLSEDIPNPFQRCPEPFPKISEPLPNTSQRFPKITRRYPEDVPTMSRDPPLMRCNFNEMRNPTANHSAPFGQNERIRLLVLFLSMSYTLVSQKNISESKQLQLLTWKGCKQAKKQKDHPNWTSRPHFELKHSFFFCDMAAMKKKDITRRYL